jgi:hypothetical protein
MTDPLNLSRRFPGDNPLDIPQLAHTPLASVPGWLMPYRQRPVDGEMARGAGLHFFLEDYRFEAVWNRPGQALKGLRPYTAVLTPDFSLYRDWPLAAQLWNVYRSRWCGAYWQANGLTVIPTVSWSTAVSYDFCFLGIPRHSVVAVATVGLRWRQDETARTLFVAGFREMLRRLSPSRVLCYGDLPPLCHDLVEIISYPTRWQGIRQARRWAEQRAAAHGR